MTTYTTFIPGYVNKMQSINGAFPFESVDITNGPNSVAIIVSSVVHKLV